MARSRAILKRPYASVAERFKRRFHTAKYDGSSPSRGTKESLITVENGFEADKIHMLERGTSPLHAIDVLDAKYPDKA